MAILLLLPGEARAQSASEISEMLDKRCQRLTRGVGLGLNNWFAEGLLHKEHLPASRMMEEAKLIREMGFRHARLMLNPYVLLNENAPENLDPEHLKILDNATDFLLAEDVAIVLTMAADDDFKAKLDTEEEFLDVFAAFWRAVASHFSSRRPAMVFLEVLNEPKVRDVQKWDRILKHLAAAIRESAPRHTLIATGSEWGTIDRLLLLEPLADPNVVYTFHFYEPYYFTHQGEPEGWIGSREPHDMPYPGKRAVVAAVIPTLTTENARKYAAEYAKENWNRAKIQGRIHLASAWAKDNGVRLYCGEFGVDRRHSPPNDRLVWIHDVRTALEKEGIGWSTWSYGKDFGVVEEVNGKPVPDPGTLRSLGLLKD